MRTHEMTRSADSLAMPGLMASMMKYGCVFEADPAPGVTGVTSEMVKAALEVKPVEPPAEPPIEPKAKTKAKEPAGPSEAELTLQADLKMAREKLAALGDLTAEEVKELRASKAGIEKAKIAAAKAKADAEEKRLKDAGDWNALQDRMREEHAKEIEAANTELAETKIKVTQLSSNLVDLNISRAFDGCLYLADETLLSPNKARKLYGDHFAIEDGKVVGYDAPIGEKRTLYVDARGVPLLFAEVIKRIIEADPDKDTLLRAKIKAGAGVTSTGARQAPPAAAQPRGVAAIAAGLGSLARR